MEYPATQRFVNDDDDDLEKEKEEDEDAGTPLKPEKKIKVGVILAEEIPYPVYKGINKVGRINSCSIIIDHSTISKEHAEIEAGGSSKTTFISDLGSLNKTKLNDVILRPGKGYQLQDGDVVRFGSVKALFKAETKGFAQSRNTDEFVIPETPAPKAKENLHPIIPGTPDLSFDRSLGDGNRSSEIITGTQEGGRSSPFLSREPSLLRVSPRRELNLDLGGDATSEISRHRDISELETQKNFSIPDSDEDEEEENIFDMMTQQSDIHNDETQKFSNDNVRTVMLSKEEYSRSIEDLETQKFTKDNNDGDNDDAIDDLETQKISVCESHQSVERIESNLVYYSMNNLETQKFGVGDIAQDSLRSVDEIEPRSDSISDIETQKFDIDDAAGGSRHVDDKAQPPSYSINNVETQKLEVLRKDDEDSETDEEGIFENSDESVDMFNAPTQLIKTPRKASQSPCEVLERDKVKDTAVGFREEEITQRRIPEVENVAEVPDADVIAEERSQTTTEVEINTELEINDEKKAALNDSIESKLNHMFDDVNEEAIEEPTQMLTQHLENILETTQVGEPSDPQQLAEDGNLASTISADRNHDEDKMEEADDDNIANLEDGEREESLKKTPNKPRAAVIQVPEILSTQELFADLPAFNIFRTPRRGRIRVSPLSDGIVTPKSEKSESGDLEVAGDTRTRYQKKGRNNAGNQSNGSKRAGSSEPVESVSRKRSKTSKSAASKVSDSGVGRNAGNQTPAKTNGRKKPRIQNEVNPTAGKLEKVSPEAEKSTNESESRKGLPLKKRGSSILSSPPTPQKNVAEVVVSTARTGTRSGVKTSSETGKKSSRLSAVDNPQNANLTTRVNYEKSKSPPPVFPAKTEPVSNNKKSTRSRRLEDTSSSADAAISKPKSPPQPRRPRKKPLEKSATISDEEVSPVKKLRTTESAGLSTNVNDRPRPVVGQRAKRTIANPPESSDPGINQDEKSLPTRTRRARLTGNTSSTDTSRNSSLLVENLDNTEHQPSLESQEIQAILGVVDQRNNDAPERRAEGSRYRAGIRAARNHEAESDQEDNTSSRLRAKTDTSKKDHEERFEKPIGRPVRTTRQSRRVEANAKEQKTDEKESRSDPVPNHHGAKKKPAVKPGRAKIADVVKEDNSSKEVSLKYPPHQTVSSDDEVENSAPLAAIVAQQAAPKSLTTTPVRGKREIPRKEEKENAVEKIAPKRGRGRQYQLKPRIPNSTVLTDDEVELSQTSTNSSNSSPLRRGRSSLSTPTSAAKSSARIKHKILFTGLNDPGLISIVNSLGGTVTEKPNDCTALVTDKVRRTYKFLCGMAMAVPIVSIEWLKQSERKGRFLETGDFLLKDPIEEAKFKFDLRRSLAKATDDKLLDGYTIVLTPNTAPPPNAEMKGIIQACGGKALARPPARWPEKSLIISRQEDLKNAKKFLTKAPKSVKLLSVEFILTGILRHELNFDEHKLEVD